MTEKEFATDAEIERAHKLLLAGSPDFEQDAIDVIKCNESRDITACPGSGKTTVLIAKLLILAERMPFKDGSGICVITHTNVAIDEIKSRFGRNADKLFSYPNFCGTIQSFIDQFLTIPWYNSFNEKPLVTVDDDRANAIIRREFYLQGWENQKKSKVLVHNNPDYKKACEAKDWNAVRTMEINAILPIYYDQAVRKFYRKYGEDDSLAVYNPKKCSDLYQILNDVRLKAYRNGILQYQDAYSTALHYLFSIPEVKQSLSERFRYVFVDEAQDSSQIQLDLLDGMFDADRVVVQRFGDPYQSLYDADKLCAWKPKTPLNINSSKRFGLSIAKVLQTVCVEDNTLLRGNPAIHSAKPVMIVYEDASQVLPKFADMLKTTKVDGESVWEIAQHERNEDKLHRYNIKAVGFAGEKIYDKDTLSSIKLYFPSFENHKASKYPFRTEVTLNSLLQKDSITNSPHEYRNKILDGILSALEKVDVTKDDGRKFNKTSMLDFLREQHRSDYEKLLANLSDWVLEMSNSEMKVKAGIFDEIKHYIMNEMANVFGYSGNDARLKDFLKKESDEYYIIPAIEQSHNIYRKGDVDIEVATVHSVKGETHAATLYLETKYYAYESEHFGKQLCGEAYKPRKRDSRVQASLKVAYVGMSRPKYFLAYAIKKDRFQKIDCKELREIWDIVYA